MNHLKGPERPREKEFASQHSPFNSGILVVHSLKYKKITIYSISQSNILYGNYITSHVTDGYKKGQWG